MSDLERFDEADQSEADRRETKLQARIEKLERILRRAVPALRHAQSRGHDFVTWCDGCNELTLVLDDVLAEAVE